MKAGIGYGNSPNVFESGRETAQMALSRGNTEKPDILLAFSSGSIDAEEFFKGLRSTVGAEVPIIGGSAVGIITNDDISYQGFPAAVAALQWDGVSQEVASVNRLDVDECRAGGTLGESLSGSVEGKLLLMF